MARLHEYQGKALLLKGGISTPRGQVARSPREAADAATALGGSCVIKVQAWTTGRAAAGGVAFAATPSEAAEHAARLLKLRFGNFPVTEVLVEERIAISRELFLSLAIDEAARAPVLLLSASGGSGVEERASLTRRIPCDVQKGPDAAALRGAISAFDLTGAGAAAVERCAMSVFGVARRLDARSLEINPLAITPDGSVVAADCRITIDDYAVARHPELGVEIARELDHPPTALERIAYRAEQADHRGTFYFAQMNTAPGAGSQGLIGFHGAGGGGSMMSMDAITAEGFTIANFCDTSGNPSPAKVYRAARVILSQPGLIGYFGSGSGVANQEQYWSAYGLAKAFWELELSIPAVVRLGGNTEDRAVEILQSACAGLPAPVEGCRKTDTPAKIAARFATLVKEHASSGWQPRPPRRPAFVERSDAAAFDVKGGKVWVDLAAWKAHAPAIIARSSGLFRDTDSGPVLTVSPDDFRAKDSEMIACEVECRRDGIPGIFVQLDIPGLNDLLAGKAGV